MTATVIPPLFECSEGSYKDSKMFDHSNNNSADVPQLMSVPVSSAICSSCTPTGSLLDRQSWGAPSAGALLQRRHSVSLPGAPFSHGQSVDEFRRDPSLVFCSSSNKENHSCERSSSELGDGLCVGRSSSEPGDTLCVGGSSQVHSSRYKTELCRPFQESAACKYGDKCQFAHGVQELRSLSRHPKYKTEPCRTFHTIGFCPYGPRCHFVHNAEERRGAPPLSTFNRMERPRLQHSFSFAGFPSTTSVTPPPTSSTEDLMKWQSFDYSNQEFASLFGPSLGPLPQGLPTPECSPSPPESVCEQEGSQSSLGSHSGSESPLLDASRRLPIFSRLSVSDD